MPSLSATLILQLTQVIDHILVNRPDGRMLIREIITKYDNPPSELNWSADTDVFTVNLVDCLAQGIRTEAKAKVLSLLLRDLCPYLDSAKQELCDVILTDIQVPAYGEQTNFSGDVNPQGEMLNTSAINSGSGAIAQGERAMAGGERSVVVDGNISESYIITGDKNQLTQINNIISNVETIEQYVAHQQVQAITKAEKQERARAIAEEKLRSGVRTYIQRLYNVIHQPANIPYKRLEKYQLNDFANFVGREKAVGELLNQIGPRRLTILYAESGSGKSSLLRAGIAFRLLDAGHLPIIVRSHRQNPSLKIKQEFVSDVLQIKPLYDMSLLEYLREISITIQNTRTLYIFLDQFEEFFHELSDDDRKSFIDDLGNCLEDEGLNVGWLLSLRREDFSNLDELRERIPNPFENSYRLQRLTQEEAKLVIRKPAEQFKFTIHQEVQERILNELTIEGHIAPPQLQLVCSALYDKLTAQTYWAPDAERIITVEMYRDAGGVKGILRGYLNQVLAAELPEKQDRDLARLAMQELVGSERRRLQYTCMELAEALSVRSQVGRKVEQIEAQLQPILETLVRSRLLDVDRELNKDVLRYELVHAYLIDELDIDPELMAQKAAQELLDQEVQVYKQHGILLSADKLAIIDSQIQYLVQISPAIELLTLSRQRHEDERSKLLRRTQYAVTGLVASLAFVVIASILGFLLVALRTEFNTTITTYLRARRLAVAKQELVSDPAKGIEVALDTSDFLLPEAEFVINQGLSLLQEQKRFSTTKGTLLTHYRFAARSSQIAVAGDELLLTDYALSSTVILGENLDPVNGVDLGAGSQVLTFLENRIQIWREGAKVKEQAFEAPISCAEWHPTSNKIFVCAGNMLWLWTPQTEERTTLYDFPAQIHTMRWSKDGSHLAVWDEGIANENHQERQTYTVVVWDAVKDKILFTKQVEHTKPIWDAAWSDNNQNLVTVSSDGIATILNIADPTTVRTVGGCPGIVGTMFVDLDRFILWSTGGDIKLWGIDGRPTDGFESNKACKEQVSVQIEGIQLLKSPEAHQFLTFFSDGQVELRDLATNKFLIKLNKHTKKVLSAHFLFMGNGKSYLATGSADGTIRIWKLDFDINVATQLSVLRGHQGTGFNERADVLFVRWQDDQHLFSVGEDGTVRLWQVFDENHVPLCVGLGDEELSSCVDPNSEMVEQTGQIVSLQWLEGAKQPDANPPLVSVSLDGTLATWDQEGQLQNKYEDERNSSTPYGVSIKVVLDPMSQCVLTYWEESVLPSAEDDSGGVIYDMNTKEEKSVPGRIDFAQWLTPEYLLLADHSGYVRLVDPKTGHIIHSLQGFQSTVTAAQLYAENRVAITDDRGNIHIWDFTIWQEVSVLSNTLASEAPFAINNLQWHSDGVRLLSAGEKVVLWNVDTKESLWMPNDPGRNLLPEFGSSVMHAAFSPDERYIAISALNKIAVVNAETFKEQWISSEHRSSLEGLTWVDNYAPTSQQAGWLNRGNESSISAKTRLLTWSRDGTARLWDTETGVEVMRMIERPDYFGLPMVITAVTTTPDGQYLLTAAHGTGEDGMVGIIRRWRIGYRDQNDLLEVARHRLEKLNAGITPS